MLVQDRIIELIKAKGLNKNSFSNLIGIQPQTLHHIVSGRRTNPSFEIVCKIISTFSDINPRWFITGEGEMFVLSADEAPIKLADSAPPGEKLMGTLLGSCGCELCKEKDRTIAAQERTIKAQEITINSLQEKIEGLTYPQRGQKRKAG